MRGRGEAGDRKKEVIVGQEGNIKRGEGEREEASEARMRKELPQIGMKITSNKMMNPVRNLSFSLLIIGLVSLRGYSPLPASSRATGTPPDLSEYEVYEDTVTPTGPVRASPQSYQQCDYDSCRENQVHCHILSASSGCLCPGFTLYDELPDAPKLTSVSWNGSGVIVRWCAPYSHVTGYIVAVEGHEELVLEEDKRSCSVRKIDHIAQVCVFAVNGAGISGNTDESCMMYHPSDSRLPLTAGLIGGAVGLLLLLLLVGLLWRRRRQKEARNV